MRRIPFAHCLVGVAVAVIVLVAFGVQPGTIVAVGLALACPLMMVLMMGGMAHGARHVHAGHAEPAQHGDRESEPTTRA